MIGNKKHGSESFHAFFVPGGGPGIELIFRYYFFSKMANGPFRYLNCVVMTEQKTSFHERLVIFVVGASLIAIILKVLFF